MWLNAAEWADGVPTRHTKTKRALTWLSGGHADGDWSCFAFLLLKLATQSHGTMLPCWCSSSFA